MSPERIGNFTSSEIGKLMSSSHAAGSIGAPFFTYVSETNMERRLGLPLDREIDARATSWGSLCEKRVFKLLDIEYRPLFSQTFRHPTIDYWVGTPDVFKNEDTVSDIKSPITRKSFCQLVDPHYDKKGNLLHDGLTIEAARENHQKGDEYFYQIVSNGIITNRKTGELIVYMPYKDELDEIRKMADGDPKLYWIQFATDEELPYLIRGGHYKNLNVISFDILQRDKDALTERVQLAGEHLIKRP
jgi:hypothetical protein